MLKEEGTADYNLKQRIMAMFEKGHIDIENEILSTRFTLDVEEYEYIMPKEHAYGSSKLEY